MTNEFAGIYKALQISGWMDLDTLLMLAFEASRHIRLVEVGSWKGRSTVAMAHYLPPNGFLWCVDTFEGPENKAGFEMDFREVIEFGPDFVLNQFKENTKDYSDKIQVIQENSATAWKTLQPLCASGYDMIFIDADHYYEKVKNDIINFGKILAPWGLLCGHDYKIPDVSKALYEIYPSERVLHIENYWCIQ